MTPFAGLVVAQEERTEMSRGRYQVERHRLGRVAKLTGRPAVASEDRTWGPFTGRHLTTIVVTLIAGLVLVPSTVWAVDTFSNVAVEDPVSGAKASVDAT